MADLPDDDAVHRYLVRHNLRAVPGNYDGQGLYGLPATMNGTGYERKGPALGGMRLNDGPFRVYRPEPEAGRGALADG